MDGYAGTSHLPPKPNQHFELSSVLKDSLVLWKPYSQFKVMNCHITLLLCVAMILANAQLSLPLVPFDTIWTNNQLRGESHRKLVYPGLRKQWLPQPVNVMFDSSKSRLNLGQKKDMTPLPDNPESKMTPIEIITGRGYPAETYSVVSEDGYVLELHRIPRGKGRTADSVPYGKPVLLQHGFLGSSADWLISPSDRNLAFQLADLGYDIWISNARGNTYSRKHQYLNPSEETFWNFSWDEMGKYDIPAIVQFILARNGKSGAKLSYIGYSMGASMFFVAMVSHPELNAKIEVMIALGPVASLAHVTSPVIRSIAPFAKHIENLLPVIDGHIPAGTSIRTGIHFAMNHNSGEHFRPYDYGVLENLRRYGKTRPPSYDLGKVTAPVYLFYGASDYLSTSEDVVWLSRRLPNLKKLIKVDDTHYNHFDFLWAKENNRLIYNRIFGILPSPN